MEISYLEFCASHHSQRIHAQLNGKNAGSSAELARLLGFKSIPVFGKSKYLIYVSITLNSFAYLPIASPMCLPSHSFTHAPCTCGFCKASLDGHGVITTMYKTLVYFK